MILKEATYWATIQMETGILITIDNKPVVQVLWSVTPQHIETQIFLAPRQSH